MDLEERIKKRKQEMESQGRTLNQSSAGDVVDLALKQSQQSDSFIIVPFETLYSEEQDRKVFKEDEILELAADIAVNGLLQPIVAAPQPDGRNLIVAGEKRHRAIGMLYKKDPVKWQNTTINSYSGDREYAMLAENIQRSNLQPVELADKLSKLKQSHGLNNKQLAQRINKTESWVSRHLALDAASDEVKEQVTKGQLSVADAAKQSKSKTPKNDTKNSSPKASINSEHLQTIVEIMAFVCSQKNLQPIDVSQLQSRKDFLTVIDSRLQDVYEALND